MKIAKDKVVAVSYELEVEGKIADKSQEGAPLEYIHGSGMLLPKFEGALEGKEVGDAFDFILSPEDGYGVYQADYKIDIPKEAFKDQTGTVREDLLIVGNIIPMIGADGNVIQGVVAEVFEEKVAMDFNHPMAGKTLHFTGKVESVRDASDKELLEGLHGEYLPPQEGGCKCGKDDGSCCGNCDCE